VDMCQKHPCTMEEMLSVSGVGQVKFERYGERFLRLLCLEERGPESSANPQEKLPEFTTELFLQQVGIEDDPLQISRIADNINAVLIRYGKPKTSGMSLNKLLVDAGFLVVTGNVKLPTDSGREIGISIVKRHSTRGNYLQCLFGTEAQRVCIELFLKNMQ